jgi:aminopeptidase 2
MDYRLPTDVSPNHYDLTLLTDLSQHQFRGAVEIDLKVNVDTTRIVLNAADLHLSDVSVTIVGGEEAFVPISQSTDKLNQRATFFFANTFPAGSSLRLFIAFEGKLTGSLIGYYEGTWEEEGKKKVYTVTQFEPTAARRVFPCWDEPLLKATFAMTMISSSNTVNLFNTPAISEEPYEQQDDIHGFLKEASSSSDDDDDDGWKMTRFESSPLMSTYLVCFANGEFGYVEDSFKSPISGRTRPIRLYSAPSLVHQGRYCLEVTAKVLPVYEQVFDIEYPLPKLDTLVVKVFLLDTSK